MAPQRPQPSFVQLAGLAHGDAFYRDRLFGLLLVAGGVFWVFLGLTLSLRPMSGHQFLSWRFLSLAFIQPCVEEFVFRGLFQGVLLTWRWGHLSWHGLSIANGVTAGVFTLLHLVNHPPLWSLAVLMPALAFGFCRDRYCSIYAAIVLHVFYNAGYFALTGLPG